MQKVNSLMTKSLVILGAGGHAAVLAELLLTAGRQLVAVVSPEPIKKGSPLAGLKQIVSDEELVVFYKPEQIELVNGIGSIPDNNTRWKLFEYFTEQGYHFASVISPHAIVSSHLELGEGVQIMAGAIVQTQAKIGENSLINTGAIVEHDCIIGAHNHIAPGATLSGGVVTEGKVHIGTGASVIQGIHIAQEAIVGAGTTIARDVPAGQVLIPARSRVLR